MHNSVPYKVLSLHVCKQLEPMEGLNPLEDVCGEEDFRVTKTCNISLCFSFHTSCCGITNGEKCMGTSWPFHHVATGQKWLLACHTTYNVMEHIWEGCYLHYSSVGTKENSLHTKYRKLPKIVTFQPSRPSSGIHSTIKSYTWWVFCRLFPVVAVVVYFNGMTTRKHICSWMLAWRRIWNSI